MTIAVGESLLRGALVRLTGVRAGDADVMARWSEESLYMRMVDSDWMRPRVSDDSPFGRAGSSPSGVEFRVRAVANDRLLGFVAVHSIEWNNQVGEISLGIGEPADWGKGYGGEAMRLTLRYAFHELNLNRVWLTVISYNDRAIRLYERLGFQREGLMREAVLRDGKRHSLLVMGLLRSEWERNIQPA